MKLDAVELRSRQRAGLVPDRVRDRGGAEVVYEGRPAEPRDSIVGEPEHTGGIRGELRAAAAVPDHVRGFEVDEVGGDPERVVEGLPVEDTAWLGLELQDRIP